MDSQHSPSMTARAIWGATKSLSALYSNTTGSPRRKSADAMITETKELRARSRLSTN